MIVKDPIASAFDGHADRAGAESAVFSLLVQLGVDVEDPNYRDTPRRVVAWLMEKLPSKESVKIQLDKLALSVFPSDYNEMITQVGIRVYGLCPHHLLPVTYDVAIGYLPQGRIIGLSKLSRAAKVVLGQAGTQEDLSAELATQLQRMLQVEDVALVAKAKHGCMTCRGIAMQNSVTITSSMHGKFMRNEGGIKSEFMQLVKMGEK